MIGVAWRQCGLGTPKEAVGNQSLWLQLLTLRAQPCNSSPKKKKPKTHLHIRTIHKWRHTESLHTAAGGEDAEHKHGQVSAQAHMLLWPRSSASRAERQMTRCPCAAAPSTARRSHARCAHTHFKGACKWEANLWACEKALRGKQARLAKGGNGALSCKCVLCRKWDQWRVNGHKTNKAKSKKNV